MRFAALPESAAGPKPKSASAAVMSAVAGKPDAEFQMARPHLLTRGRHHAKS